MATRKQNYVGAPKGNQNAKSRGKTAGAAVGGAAGAGATALISGRIAESGRTVGKGFSAGKIGKKYAGGGAAVMTAGIGGSRVTASGAVGKTTGPRASNITSSGFTTKRGSGIIGAKFKTATGKTMGVGAGFSAPTAALTGMAGAALGTAAGAGYNQYKKRRSKKT